jgi:hypothetical protein
MNRRYTELKKHRRKCGVTFDTGTGITAYARLRVLAVVLMELQVLRYVTPCRWVSSHRHFAGPQRDRIKGQAVKEALTLKMTALKSLKLR